MAGYMKLLFLNTNSDYGGASKILAFLANSMADLGYDVTYLTYRDDTELQNFINVKHEHIQIESTGGSIKTLIASVIKIRKYLKVNNFDVAVAFLSPSQLRLAFADMGLRTKIIFSHRGDPTRESVNNVFIHKLNELAFGMADYYVFQTEGAKSCFSKKIQSKSTIIPNPISKINRYSYTCIDKSNRIVHVARLDIYQKRQDILIEAFQKFNKEEPSYKLELYGDGPDMEKLQELAKGNDNIVFCGATNQVNKKIYGASMFVLSSDFEGIPNALMEAMALGLPCISTDCTPGGAALLIKDGVNGLLTERDNADALCKAMLKLARDKELADRLGNEAKKVSEIFAEERIIEQWKNVFEKLI